MRLKQTYWNSFLMGLAGLGSGWQLLHDLGLGLILAAAFASAYLLGALAYWRKRSLAITGTTSLKELEWFYSLALEYQFMSLDKLREAYFWRKSPNVGVEAAPRLPKRRVFGDSVSSPISFHTNVACGSGNIHPTGTPRLH